MKQTTVSSSIHNNVLRLYELYRDNVMRYFLAFTHNVQDAEDMTQDVFLRLLGLDLIAPETARTLLFVCARHRIADFCRHRKCAGLYQRERQTECNEEPNTLQEQLEARDLLRLEGRIVEQLPRQQAHVYRLFRHQGLSAREISEQLHLSVRTVEAHVYAATRQVRRQLADAM